MEKWGIEGHHFKGILFLNNPENGKCVTATHKTGALSLMSVQISKAKQKGRKTLDLKYRFVLFFF